MKKQYPLILLSILMLPACSTENKADSFCCYYGNMTVSKMSVNYSSVSNKKILWNSNPNDMDYHANLYCLTNQNEYDDFLKNTPFLSNTDEEPKQLQSGNMEVICFAQIPNGYEAYKRDNIQFINPDGSVKMITDNFYYYENRTELSYLTIDIRKVSEPKENSVFCLKYLLPVTYTATVKKENIRVMFSSR